MSHARDHIPPIQKQNMSVHKAYPVPLGRPVRGTILALHGGCFTGGSVEYDREQNCALRDAGFNVIQLAFPKTSIGAFRAWGKTLSLYLAPPICLLGRSSGGYLAKELYDLSKDGLIPLQIDAAIYLAPVFDPFKRADLVPKMKSKTALFFSDGQPIETTPSLDKQELLCLATKDLNVPRGCFTPAQLAQACELGIESHLDLCTTALPRVIAKIVKHIDAVITLA